MDLVTLADVEAAARRIEGVALRTPLLPCPWADPARPLRLKAESLQPIGAFKIRGATNMIAGLPPDALARGIVTHSSGNHGRAVAYAARRFGVGAVVVVPAGAPAVKLEAMRALGAEIVVVDPAERLARAEALVAEHGYAFVPPYDAPEIIAGQGTIGREIAADWPEVRTVLVPVGGGGLSSGVAVAVTSLLPHARVVGVEPELAADARDSLRAGELVRWPAERRYRTIADGVRTDLSELTFAHLRAYVDDIVTVSEEEIATAVGVLAREARLVAEPSGALTTAAYLYRAAELPPGPYAAVVSGGNVDPEPFARWVSATERVRP